MSLDQTPTTGISLTREAVDELLTGHPYRYAKTMNWCPHWYTLRKEWEDVGEGVFEAVVQFIRDHGYVEKFGKSRFIRLNVGELKYWTMGEPLRSAKLINRAYIGKTPVAAIPPEYQKAAIEKAPPGYLDI